MKKPLRVLIVEDEDDDALLLLRELERGGYAPTSRQVCTEVALREALQSAEWDIVISDWSMPRWSGLAAFHVMRELGLDLPFIIISGTIGEEIAVEALRAGVHDFMAKGRFARLLPAIERELREAEVRKKRREAEAALERKQIEIEQSERLLRLVVDSVPDGVVVTDEQGRFVLTNPAAAQMLVHPDHDLDPREWPERFGLRHPDEGRFYEPEELALSRALRGQAVDGQETLLQASGETSGRFLSVNARPLRDEQGGTRGAVAVFRDVTKEKASQEQLMISDRMVSIGMLAAGVGHEINNPLTAVLGNLDLARSELESGSSLEGKRDDLARMLDDAAAAAERVRLIVRDLKIFSRQQESDSGAVELSPILESSLRMAWNEIRNRARVETSFGAVPLVDASEPRLGQVFLNLIVNAAQAMAAGTLDQHVLRVSTHTATDGQAVVEISDTGIGMSPETLRQLFRPFFTTKPVGVGTGLGLAICRRIVSGLGGDITVTSTLGVGTTFHVTLPPSKALHARAASEAPAVVAAPRRARVLAVDDEPMIGALIRAALCDDHEVFTTTQASDVLDLLHAGERFDVLLCDVMMPRVAGIDLHAQVEKLDPALGKHTIFMTGGAFNERDRTFLESIENPILEKPFDRDGLCNLVNGVLRNGKSQPHVVSRNDDAAIPLEIAARRA